MDQLFDNSMSKQERIVQLESMACKIEEGKYFKKLSKEEIESKKENLSDNIIKLSELEQEKKDYILENKGNQKPLLEDNKFLIEVIKTRQEEKNGRIYYIDQQEEGQMYMYDEDGNLIDQRRLRPDEKQTTIFSINKHVSNG